MKRLGPLLAGGLTLAIVMVIGIFSFLPPEVLPQPEQAEVAAADNSSSDQIVIPAVDTSQLEATMAGRKATYQAQIEELSRAMQEHQAIYQGQIQELTAQITAAQNQLNDLKAQEPSLSGQITQLENTRAERQAAYQAQLQDFQNQYNDRIVQLQAQLNEAQTRLAEANAQLGR